MRIALAWEAPGRFQWSTAGPPWRAARPSRASRRPAAIRNTGRVEVVVQLPGDAASASLTRSRHATTVRTHVVRRRLKSRDLKERRQSDRVAVSVAFGARARHDGESHRVRALAGSPGGSTRCRLRPATDAAGAAPRAGRR